MNTYDDDEVGAGVDVYSNGLVADDQLDAQIAEVMADYEEQPLLVRKLTSTNIDDLKTLSEIPRRLVFAFTNMDVVIRSGEMLALRLYEAATNSIQRAGVLEAEADALLTDDIEENDAEGHKIKAKAMRHKRRGAHYLEVATHMRAGGTHVLMRQYRMSALQYLQGVERKGRLELIEALVAMGQNEEGQEVDTS